MMPVHFYNPGALVWLWLVPAAAGLFFYAAVKRKLAIKAFGAGTAAISRKREAFAGCAAVALVVLALARPAWNLQEQAMQESGRDVIFLLDVSRSMLAGDMHPNRLEHAKTAVLDCIEALSGDRVGLVLFAGSAEIRCPLTADYDYFRMALRQASPESVAAGGTMIANALGKTVDKLIDPDKKGLQDIILITDGEDMVEGSDEVDEARALGEAGARLIAIGIGDRARGSRISLEDGESGAVSFMKHDNREVWTKLHSEMLQKMSAAVPEGVYFEVGSGPFDLRTIYRQVMEHAQRTSVEKQVMESYDEKFHLFLGGAVLVLLLSHRWRFRGAQVVLGLLLLGPTADANPAELFQKGNNAYAAGQFDAAETFFQEAASEAPESAEIFFNLGNAQYRAGSFEDAQGSFEYAASLAKTDAMRGQCWYNLGNCLVKSAEGLRENAPQEAVEYCRQAVALYRTALEYNPEFGDAAYNLEISQRIAAAIGEEIKQQEEQQQQENELIKYIREKLEEFIKRQTGLNASGTTGDPQKILEQETRALAKVMEDSGLDKDIALPDGTTVPGPLKECRTHTLKAADAMTVPDQPTALAELIAALGAAPDDPDKQDGESDQEADQDEQSDMEYEEADQDADMYEEADPFGDFSEYEEIRGVPPPNQTEMDILSEEVRNQDRRKAKTTGEYKAVEKDW